MRPGDTPRTLICVWGEASGVFGAGEIVSFASAGAASAPANRRARRIREVTLVDSDYNSCCNGRQPIRSHEMAQTRTAPEAPRGRRLSPEARREHILDVAREIFAERPYTLVTTADVAEKAGVARSLVHHYFGGIGEVFVAVVADGASALSDVRTAGTETPVDERLKHNITASLDVIEA